MPETKPATPVEVITNAPSPSVSVAVAEPPMNAFTPVIASSVVVAPARTCCSKKKEPLRLPSGPNASGVASLKSSSTRR